MSKHVVRVPGAGRQPWLDVVSYGRRGHQLPDRFTPAQLQHIARVVRRAPEVVVKVSGGGQSVGAVAAHAQYIGRHGKVELLTDEGERLQGKKAAETLTEGWDLAMSEGQYGQKTRGRGDRCAPRLAYNIVLSMPKLTDPDKLVRAVSAFARETFALNHRYAYALHTDTAHPHVHLIVKAVSEQGKRLHVQKATLRSWREAFAEQLRAQGVQAAATPSPLRGRAAGHKNDGAYRLAMRGKLANTRRTSSPSSLKADARQRNDSKLARRQVTDDWMNTLDTLHAQGAHALAVEVSAYVGTLRRTPADRDAQLTPEKSREPEYRGR